MITLRYAYKFVKILVRAGQLSANYALMLILAIALISPQNSKAEDPKDSKVSEMCSVFLTYASTLGTQELALFVFETGADFFANRALMEEQYEKHKEARKYYQLSGKLNAVFARLTEGWPIAEEGSFLSSRQRGFLAALTVKRSTIEELEKFKSLVISELDKDPRDDMRVIAQKLIVAIEHLILRTKNEKGASQDAFSPDSQ